MSDYSDAVIADAPTVFYECEEVSGTLAVDSSGNGNDGTINGTPDAYSVPVAPGCGNGFGIGSFSTVDALIQVPHAAFTPGAGDFTVEAVVEHLKDLVGDTFVSVIYAFRDGTFSFYVGIFSDGETGDLPRLGINWLGGTIFLDEYPAGLGAHLVQFTYDSAAGTIMTTIDGVDGGPVSGLTPETFGTATVSAFGGSTDTLHGFFGNIDECALYNAQLGSGRRGIHYDLAFPSIPPPPPPASGTAGYRWEVLVRNHDLSIAGLLEVTDFELHLKYQDIGTWTVDFVGLDSDGNVNIPAAALEQRGAGLVFKLNDRTIMSGPWTKPVRTRSGDQRTFSVSGVDDCQLLADTIAHPQPSASFPPYGQLQDVRGPGAAETIIKQFVNVNCGPGAVAARRRFGLSIEPDLVRGLSVVGIGDWTKQLDVLIQSLAQAGGVGYRVIQTDAPGLQFQVFVPFDRTSTVVFGVELGNTNGYSYSLQRPAGNYVYALGAGTGISRSIHEGEDPVSVGAYGRIETVSDQSGTADPAVLEQAIATQLASSAEQFSATVTALDTKAHSWAPVAADPTTAYDLGDEVSVLIEEVQFAETITEIVATFSADKGSVIAPIVGTPLLGARQNLTRDLVARVKQLTRQMRVRQGV